MDVVDLAGLPVAFKPERITDSRYNMIIGDGKRPAVFIKKSQILFSNVSFL